MSCDTHVALMRPAKSAVRLPELTKYGEAKEARMLERNQVAENLRFNSAAPIVRRPGGPGGVPYLATKHHAEVPGALLEGCWLYATSVQFCNCGLPLIHVLRL